MKLTINQQAFFALVRAGLWEENVRLSSFGMIDYSEVMRLTEEQSVWGLITVGLEHVADVKVPKEELLQFVGQTIRLEERNKAMNVFLARLIERLREQEVYAVLVKGQGIAQCYEKPLWRSPGDIDLLLSNTNYENAKKVLMPLANDVEMEFKTFMHQGMTMDDGYVVELHGTMHSRLSKKIDKVTDDAQRDVFYGGSVRPWKIENTVVYLPSPDNDVIFVFTHILHHYYIEGVGLRQICDWCRLLYTYKDLLNYDLLESRIQEAGLMSEWRAFAAFAVDWLGMPVKAMPLYSQEKKWSRKAESVLDFVMETGSFGHNRQVSSGKIKSAWRRVKDFTRHYRIFPLDSVKFFSHFMIDGIKLAFAK